MATPDPLPLTDDVIPDGLLDQLRELAERVRDGEGTLFTNEDGEVEDPPTTLERWREYVAREIEWLADKGILPADHVDAIALRNYATVCETRRLAATRAQDDAEAEQVRLMLEIADGIAKVAPDALGAALRTEVQRLQGKLTELGRERDSLRSQVNFLRSGSGARAIELEKERTDAIRLRYLIASGFLAVKKVGDEKPTVGYVAVSEWIDAQMVKAENLAAALVAADPTRWDC